MSRWSSGAETDVSVAENYQRYLEPVLFAPWAHRLVAYAGVRPGDTVLDLAAGTGAVSRVAARAGASVIAADSSAPMLEHVPAGIRTLVCPADALDLPDGSVDVVLCQQGLQFVADPLAALREALRVLRPGGVVAVSVWATDERLDPFDAFAEALQRDATAAGSSRTISNAAVATTVHGVVDQLLVAGAADVRATRQELAVRWPTVDSEVAALFGTPFGPFLERLPSERQEDVLDDVRRQLDHDGRTVAHVTTSVLGRGVKRVE